MKKLLPLMLIFSLALFFACDTGGGSTTNPDNGGTENPDGGTTDPDNGGNPVLTTAVKVTDNSGNFLGYLIDTCPTSINIMTESGYLVGLTWSGELENIDFNDIPYFYYTEQNGGGTPFLITGVGFDYFSKIVWVSINNTYTFRDSNTQGTAANDPSITEYSSFWSGYYADGFQNKTPPEPTGTDRLCLVLKPITQTEIGLPATISLPIKFVYPE